MEKNEEYRRLTDKYSPPSATLKHMAGAFFIGGLICLFGEALFLLYTYLGASEKNGYLYVTLTLIFLASAFTALGFFDKLAAFAGAGTLVPVTGFSNAVTSSAIDTGSEGYIAGVGTKIFTVAGPVILYASLAGILYGFVYFLYLILV